MQTPRPTAASAPGRLVERGRASRSHSPHALLGVGVLLAALLAGCAPSRVGGSKTPEQALNDLRARNFELKQQIEELDRRMALKMAELEAMEQRLQGKVEFEGVDPADLPQAVELEIDEFSGPIDNDNDGRHDVVVFYVKTLDQRDRFIPIAGLANAQLVIIEPDTEPRILAQQAWEPKAFARTYRSGITGTHYTLEVPLPPEGLPEDLKQVTAKITITDAATGVSLTSETPVKLRG